MNLDLFGAYGATSGPVMQFIIPVEVYFVLCIPLSAISTTSSTSDDSDDVPATSLVRHCTTEFLPQGLNALVYVCFAKYIDCV